MIVIEIKEVEDTYDEKCKEQDGKENINLDAQDKCILRGDTCNTIIDKDSKNNMGRMDDDNRMTERDKALLEFLDLDDYLPNQDCYYYQCIREYIEEIKKDIVEENRRGY